MANTVELTGVFGGDETHALSAWTSTSRELTESKKGRMDKLLHTLAADGHHTPFEKSYIQFLVTVDTASHIHILKHRIGLAVNGESARYKEHTEDKYLIPSDWPDKERARLDEFSRDAFKAYHDTVERLVTVHGFDRKRAKESARFYLPYNSQVVLDVAFNFRSFMHFMGLRNKEAAQMEIREIADEMLQQVRATGQFTESLKGFGW